MNTPHPKVVGALSIVRLGKSDWRVSSAVDPDELLGYIERQRTGRFEVVWMTDPMRWGYATSFEEALVAFGDSVRFTGEILDDRAPSELFTLLKAAWRWLKTHSAADKRPRWRPHRHESCSDSAASTLKKRQRSLPGTSRASRSTRLVRSSGFTEPQ